MSKLLDILPSLVLIAATISAIKYSIADNDTNCLISVCIIVIANVFLEVRKLNKKLDK